MKFLITYVVIERISGSIHKRRPQMEREPFQSEMYQNRWQLGLHPRPRGESLWRAYSALQTP